MNTVQLRHTILEPMQEFRFEVDPKQTMTIKVRNINSITQGRAEMFGAEMAVNTEYTFTARKAAVFTWQGCKIETSGNAVEYVGHEVTVPTHLNIHFALEETRKVAYAMGSPGPRVMVVGPADAGKTTLCKTLVNYAARCGTRTILCDIDPEEVNIAK